MIKKLCCLQIMQKHLMYVIKQQIGIPLSQEELNAEEALKKIIEE